MSKSAERYATRDEIERTYATCERLLSRLDELRTALRSMRYRSAFDDAALARMATLADSIRSFEPSEHAADPIADCLSDCLADPQSASTVAHWESLFSDFEDILRKEQSGDFFPFPEPLQDGERRVLAAKLGELLRELDSIATDADDLAAPLQANMRYAAATKPFEPFRMLDDTQRTVLSCPLHLCRLFRSWGRLAQVYLLSGEQSLRDALRSTRIPKWDPQELAYRIDSERSQLLRDLAELAPSLTSQSEPHRQTAASDAPEAADTPSTTAAIDRPSAEPSTAEGYWSEWSEYMSKRDIEVQLGRGCWRTLARNSGNLERGWTHEIEKDSANIQQARYRTWTPLKVDTQKKES